MKFKKFIIFQIMLALLGPVGLVESSAVAEKVNVKRKRTIKSLKRKSRVKQKAKPKKVIKLSDDQMLRKVIADHSAKKMSNAQAWEALDELSSSKKLSDNNRRLLEQKQSLLLIGSGYPISAAIVTKNQLLNFKDPSDEKTFQSWRILKSVSEKRPIQFLVSEVASEVKLRNKSAPEFGKDWYYWIGMGSLENGKVKDAIANFEKLTIVDRYFFPAKYQLALIYYNKKEYKKAIINLNTIISKSVQSVSSLRDKEMAEIKNYAYLAKGRINYELKKFRYALDAYRMVDRDSPLFYDALFEQSWAFFMAGYPNHALGALHAVESPFFVDRVFNPEAPILRSIAHYWICDYEEGKNALADFSERYEGSVKELSRFLDRKRLRSDLGYQLFEDLLSGVSSKSLGVDRDILMTAADKESMLLIRDQYASLLSELTRVNSRGIFGSKVGVSKVVQNLEFLSGRMQKKIGKIFISELVNMKDQFERLYDQAEFLYLELLMSEKEQLLGRELHSETKIAEVSGNLSVKGWGSGNQKWASQDKQEFWWDEVGFYIYDKQPSCNK